MREQTLIRIDIDYLKNTLKALAAQEQKKIDTSSAKYEVEIAERDRIINDREQQLRGIYLPLIQGVEAEFRIEYDRFPLGRRLYRSRADGEGERYFSIILDQNLHDHLQECEYYWFERMKEIAHYKVDRGLVAYTIKTSDLPKPRQVTTTRLTQLQSYLAWAENLPRDPDDCLITQEQAKFIGLDLEYGQSYQYQLMPG